MCTKFTNIMVLSWPPRRLPTVRYKFTFMDKHDTNCQAKRKNMSQKLHTEFVESNVRE